MKKHNKFKIGLTVTIMVLLTAVNVNNIIEKDEKNVLTDRSELISSGGLDFVEIPSVTKRYIAPMNPSGQATYTIHSFSVNRPANYSLNISAYYGVIDGIPMNSWSPGDEYCAASYRYYDSYWMVVVENKSSTSNKKELIMGIGFTQNSFTWTKIGNVNETKNLAIAGNTTDIRIVYTETNKTSHGYYDGGFQGVRCFNTSNGGLSWSRSVLRDYSGWENVTFHGISIAKNESRFVCMWGVSASGFVNESTIWECEEVMRPYRLGWTAPENLTALRGKSAFEPQVFFNHSCQQEPFKYNGTLFVAYNYFPNPKETYVTVNISRLRDGPNGAETENWAIPCSHPDYNLKGYSYYKQIRELNRDDTYDDDVIDHPFVYCAMDYVDGEFYFLDTTRAFYTGVQKAIKFGGAIDSQFDSIQAECNRSFNLYAFQEPLFFTGRALGDDDVRRPGILTTIHLKYWQISNEIDAYDVSSKIFDGWDESHSYSDDNAYSLNLFVKANNEYLKYDIVIYVDNVAATVEDSITSINKISPFSSLGTQDSFNLAVSADKEGTMSFFVQSDTAVSAQGSISEGLYNCLSPVMCGDGINNYIFFTQQQGEAYHLTFLVSHDGGLSWEVPRIIKSSISMDWNIKHAKMSGSEIYLWSEGYLYSSGDGGNTFSITQQTELKCQYVQGVSDDLSTWFAWKKGPNELGINKSDDLGFSNQLFATVSIPNAQYYSIEAAAGNGQGFMMNANYSFLIVNNLTIRDAYFATADKDGIKISLSDNILANAHTYDPSMPITGMVDLYAHRKEDFSYEWVIVSSAINITQEIFGYISICNSSVDKPLSFSPWRNFTEITGGYLYSPQAWFLSKPAKNWDLIFPDDEYPCFVTSNFMGQGTYNKKLNTAAKSSVVFGETKQLNSYFRADVTFSGLSNANGILSDGNYTWSVYVEDRVGNGYRNEGTILIDNTNPVLEEHDNLTTPENPYPTDNVLVTIPIYDVNPSQGTLYYRIPGGSWQSTAMSFDKTTAPYIDFKGTIPSQSADVNTIYWKVVIKDKCGNELSVDNNGQLYSYSKGVFELSKQAGAGSTPTLYDDWSWTYTFTSGTDHLSQVFLRTIYGEELQTSGSSQIDTIVKAIDAYNTTYSVHVAHDITHQNITYKFMYRTDIGTEYLIEEIFLKRPVIRIEEESEPPTSIDLSLVKSFNVSFVVPDYSSYIDHMYIVYQFDNGSGTIKENLTSTGSTYRFSIADFSADVTLINYTVYAIDKFGQTIPLGKQRVVQLIPALPAWEMTSEQQVLVVIIAAIVGVGVAIVFSSLVNQQASKKTGFRALSQKLSAKELREVASEDSIMKKIEGTREEGLEKLMTSYKYVTMLDAGLLIAFGVSAMIIFLLFQVATVAMVILVGALLSSIFLWVLSSIQSVEGAFRAEKVKSIMSDQLKLMLISLLIFGILVSIFMIGNTIAWWRVRVNLTSYNIAGLVIPKALTTVTTTFFTSIFLLTWSTFKEVGRKTKELERAITFNENPLDIIERREAAISKVVRNVGTKGILFVAIIGITIIFASDLNVYANQGILIIIPFAIGAIVTQIILAVLRRRKPITMESISYDNLIKCPDCGKVTALGGNYCEKCGQSLITGKRITEGIQCNNCYNINATEIEYCRYCKTTIDPSQIKRRTGRIFKKKQVKEIDTKESMEKKSTEVKKDSQEIKAEDIQKESSTESQKSAPNIAPKSTPKKPDKSAPKTSGKQDPKKSK